MRFTISAAILIATANFAVAQQCAPLELVYARATTEPPVGITVDTSAQDFESAAGKVWTKGYGAAGNSLLTNLTLLLPQAIGYPVHYPANSQANISAPVGVKDMIAHLEKVSIACPKTFFALGGHSQGSSVTVSAIPKISKDILSKVIAVTMFGGRDCPVEVKDRCKSYCNAGDVACMPGAKSGSGMPKSSMPPPPPYPKDPAGLPTPKGPYGPLAEIPGVPKNGLPQTPPRPALPSTGAVAPPPAIPPVDVPPPKEVVPPKGVLVEPKAVIAPPGVPAIVVPQMVVPSPAALPAASTGPVSRIMKRQAKAMTCSVPEVEEKGHVPITVNGESAHTVYNKDGYYVQAAACYIYNKYKAAAGAK